MSETTVQNYEFDLHTLPGRWFLRVARRVEKEGGPGAIDVRFGRAGTNHIPGSMPVIMRPAARFLLGLLARGPQAGACDELAAIFMEDVILASPELRE